MGSRVLVVQTGFLGDAVLSTALVSSLAGRADVASVGLLVRAGYADLFAPHPAVNQLYGLRKGERREARKMVERLRDDSYDVALIPHRSLSTALLCARSGIPERFGFRVADGSFLYTERVDYRVGIPEVVRNNDLLRAWSGEEDRGDLPRTKLTVSGETRLHTDSDRTVAIAYGSVWRTKQWGSERYAELCRRLIREGVRPILVGSPEERPEGEMIADVAGIPQEDRLSGRLSLPALADLLATVGLAVSNDSGAMHVAEAVGTPVVSIFGPTIREFGFAPILDSSVLAEVSELPCRPCGIHGSESCPLGHHQCMAMVSVDTVFALVMNQLSEITVGGEK